MNNTLLNAVKSIGEQSQRTTYVLFVLDKSGSMAQGQAQTLSTYNQQIKAICSSNERVEVGLITFSDRIAMQGFIPAHRVQELTARDYRPDGGTALYDAIGYGLAMLEDIARTAPAGNVGYLMSILTDGGEMSSRFYKPDELGSRIERLQATEQWSFTLMGPDRNLKEMKRILKIHPDNVCGFEPESQESRQWVSDTEFAKMNTYMTMRSQGVCASQSLYSGTK